MDQGDIFLFPKKKQYEGDEEFEKVSIMYHESLPLPTSQE